MMTGEFWKAAFEILLAIEVARLGLSYAMFLRKRGVGADEPDPEWENEVEYANWDE